ncbi:MAG: helix-turn-helix domain-containing protein [Flavobacteriales bacterium]|jgi:excisionase family DNA binding protein|nr:helix-turn-helix domain-containing protein [Flavobacteriales bacterium]
MTEDLSFDKLPKAVAILMKEVFEIKRLLVEIEGQNNIPEPELFLTIKETAKFLNLKVPTIYSKVSRGELPVMKRGKSLYFSKAELIEYLKEGRKMSNSDLDKQVENYLRDN